ncbi:monocarboxylate transporter 10 isoform X2 [Chrysoperla carnea]|uniref:monocarboxylate transporter 10 isoform X2 n=1 Tax=Chrysoperla carnea TaxID=189513 RepID=UPI001D06C2E0|nr:monocarboxylate transporter 10 isoform X2 [Chrysoperla carnea]
MAGNSLENGKLHQQSGKINNGLNNNISILPPDGGTRAWLIMLGSFFCNGILFGVVNSYGLIFVELKLNLQKAGVDEYSSKAALVGSLTIGTTFFLSPIAGILTDRIGIRRTTLLGGAIASGGMFLSSFLTEHVEYLYFTYGIMFGLGASLAYTPSLVILGHYFQKYLGFVNGVVTAGSSTFTVIMPLILKNILPTFGLENSLRILSLLVGCIMLCALLFKPIKIPTHTEYKDDTLKKIINVDIWKLPKYVIWTLSIPIALFGYFVPYVHIKEFCNVYFPNSDGTLPVICVGITSGIGRLVFGYIADSPKVNRILLQQISFFSIGILTILLTFANSFVWLLVISLGMGLFDGCFISLLGPIAFDLCGKDGATQAIGFLLGMCSIPLTIGPPVAGYLYDRTGSYQLPFILAGIPPIIGALVMFSTRCVKNDSKSSKYNTQIVKNGCLPSGRNNDNDNIREPLTNGCNGTVPLSISYKDAVARASAESLSDVPTTPKKKY